jgi:hypothetical protein
MTVRRVVQADLTDWLRDPPAAGAVVTSLPDAAEVGMQPDAWLEWYTSALLLCWERAVTLVGGPFVLLATDRKRDGHLVSKALLALEVVGPELLLWHRIALRRQPGQRDIHRPTYTHILAFGGRPGPPMPDVVPPGRHPSRNSVSVPAALHVAAFLASVGTRTVLNPACGAGTLLAAANAYGLDAYGCDTDPACVSRASLLVLDPGVPD